MTAPSPNRHDDTREICCPRCGYDLRGVVAVWKDTCPLTGACSECGLEFAWDDLFRPARFAPQWCVEFTPRRRGVPLAALKTWLRSFWPSGFWQHLKMSQPIRWRRLAAYCLLLLAPLLLVYASVQASVAVMVLNQKQFEIAQQMAALPGASMAMARTPIAVPNWIKVLPSVEIAWRHTQEGYRQAALASYAQMLKTPPTINQSHANAIFEAVFLPLSSRSSGTVSFPNYVGGTLVGQRSFMYAAPATLYREFFSNIRYSSSWRTWEVGGMALAALAWWSLVMLLAPLSLALLPVTRRRAKVRWAHIVRVMIYGFFVPTMVAYVGSLLLVAGMVGPPAMRALAQLLLVPLPVVIMPLMLVVWWWAAIRFYLRLPHALSVTLLMGVLCFLVVVAAVFYGGMALFA